MARGISHMRLMDRKAIIALGAAIAVAACSAVAGPARAAEFPWEPATPAAPPPLNAPQSKAPVFKTPGVEAPSRVVPGHWSRYGFVPTRKSEGPPPAPAAPGEKTQGWVPGHHDNNGAWVPGHPE